MAAPERPNHRLGSPAAKLERARRFALGLPEAFEAPHFEYNSFRVKGKIFATVPTEGDRLHIFVGEGDVEELVASAPDIIERVYWGAKVAGVRVWMANADDADIEEVLEAAWRRKAPKRLAAQYDLGRGHSGEIT